jgi:hypothetical protein
LYRFVALRRPALLVVDRFALAGYEAARRFNISFLVNSVALLGDLDDPPSHLPAPFVESYGPAYSSGLNTAGPGGAHAADAREYLEWRPRAFQWLTAWPQSVWERLWNLWYRVRYRLDLLSALRALNLIRTAVTDPFAAAPADAALAHAGGIQWQPFQPLSSLSEWHGACIVMLNTVLGIDYSRSIPPRFRFLGPLLPQADAEESADARHATSATTEQESSNMDETGKGDESVSGSREHGGLSALYEAALPAELLPWLDDAVKRSHPIVFVDLSHALELLSTEQLDEIVRTRLHARCDGAQLTRSICCGCARSGRRWTDCTATSRRACCLAFRLRL